MGRRALDFTAEQDQILRARYTALGPTRLSEMFGMNPERVYKRARLLGLVKAREPNWQPEEDEVLRDRYAEGGVKACRPLLPGRNRQGIQARAAGLGIRYRAPGGTFDHRALAKALGMNKGVPPSLARMPAVVHRCPGAGL